MFLTESQAKMDLYLTFKRGAVMEFISFIFGACITVVAIQIIGYKIIDLTV